MADFINIPAGPVQDIQKQSLLARMTAAEVHGWYRAATRAGATDNPVAGDRNALYSWLRWTNMADVVNLNNADLRGLATVWIALGMTPARAEEILMPRAA